MLKEMWSAGLYGEIVPGDGRGHTSLRRPEEQATGSGLSVPHSLEGIGFPLGLVVL